MKDVPAPKCDHFCWLAIQRLEADRASRTRLDLPPCAGEHLAQLLQRGRTTIACSCCLGGLVAYCLRKAAAVVAPLCRRCGRLYGRRTDKWGTFCMRAVHEVCQHGLLDAGIARPPRVRKRLAPEKSAAFGDELVFFSCAQHAR
jgi:hypothetical protein